MTGRARGGKKEEGEFKERKNRKKRYKRNAEKIKCGNLISVTYTYTPNPPDPPKF